MPQIALVFPGIGSEFVGMGKSFYENFAIARQTFSEANDTLQMDLTHQCFAGELSDLRKPTFSLPAILTVNIATFRVYMTEIGFLPLCCAGHSFGEISALAAAGLIKFSDALKLASWCGRSISELVTPGAGSMALASGIEARVIEEECKRISRPQELVTVANYNSTDQFAVSGHLNAVSRLGEKLKSMGAAFVVLKGAPPIHSPLMEPLAPPFQAELAKYQYYQPEFQVISNKDALPYLDPADVPKKLGEEMTQPVLWRTTIEYIADMGVATIIEIGPMLSLKNLVQKNAPQIATFALNKIDDLTTIAKLAASDTANQADKIFPDARDLSDILTRLAKGEISVAEAESLISPK